MMPTKLQTWRWVIVSFFFLTLFLYRPYQLQLFGMMYSGDDASYFAYGTSFAYGKYPSLQNEFFTESKVPPLSRIGPGLLAAPLIATFSLVDRLQGSTIITQRNEANVLPSWSLFGAFFSAVLALFASCWLIFNVLEWRYGPKTAALTVIATVLLQGAPLYAFRRPVFSHVYELLIQSFFLWIFDSICRLNKSDLKPLSARWMIAMASASGLLILVRQNGIPYALLWPFWIVAFSHHRPLESLRKNAVSMSVCLFLGLATAYALKHFPAWSDPSTYAPVIQKFEDSSFLSELRRPSYYAYRLYQIFLGIDWGLVFTAPFILVGLFGIRFLDRSQRLPFGLLAAPLLIHLYVVVLWSGQGGWYGYRYLVFSAIPILAIPTAEIFSRMLKQSYGRWILTLLMIPPAMSMLAFEGNDSNLTLWSVTSPWGEPYVGNTTFQMQVWKSVFVHPTEFFYAIFKAGPSYLFYLLAHAFGKSALLPAKFSKVYSEFRWDILVKTALIYTIPGIALWRSRGQLNPGKHNRLSKSRPPNFSLRSVAMKKKTRRENG